MLVILMLGYVFEFINAVMVKSPAGHFFVITDIVFFWGGEGGRGGREGEGEGNRHTRDNIPCSSLADAVNLPCARSFERLKVGRRVG